MIFEYKYLNYLQQEQVLGELYWYTHQNPPPEDVTAAKETLLYLEACNLLFEQGFLSHDRVRSADSQVLANIDKGFAYFTEWLDSLLKTGIMLFVWYCFYKYVFNRSNVSTHISNAKVFFVMAK